MKILQKFCAVLLLLSGSMFASDLQVEKITSSDLAAYREIFFKFGHAFCGQPAGLDEHMAAIFDQEEKDFAAQANGILFFGATLEDQTVGYLSCDVGLEGSVIVRQIAFDPVMYDADLIKELLFAIFASMPKVKHISISCPVACCDMAFLFEDLGFVKLTGTAGSLAGSDFVEYELIVHQKCKICDILYPKGYWITEYEDIGDGELPNNWDNDEIDHQQGSNYPFDMSSDEPS